MTAQTIMNPNPVALRSMDTVGTAAQYMLAHHLRHLPVVDEEGRYLGIFGIFSLLQLTMPKAVMVNGGLEDVSFLSGGLPELRGRLQEHADELVIDSLRQDVPTVSPDTPLIETVLLLLRTRMALPVVIEETGRLVGTISSWEALNRIAGEEGA